jgi:hypothetical protein
MGNLNHKTNQDDHGHVCESISGHGAASEPSN